LPLAAACVMWAVSRFVLGLLLLAFAAGSSWPHDASSYGGLFRSRNLGGTWLRADVGLFLNVPLIVAVDPHNPSHLLAGTDLGLIVSHNGGLTWVPETRDLIFGAVFAAVFLDGGERAICAAQSGVFRLEDGHWSAARVPEAAIPARMLAVGASADQIYLLGRSRLFASGDGARTFSEVHRILDGREMTALAVIHSEPVGIVTVVDGQVMASDDGGGRWRPSALGGQAGPVDIVTGDAQVPQRVWAAGTGRLSFSDDRGSSWRAAGRGLPEPATKVRGIAANAEAKVLVVSTNRGLYRSEDGGETWVLKQDNLPIHLEAGPLARDPADPNVLYAVYALMPYSEAWRIAVESGNLSRPLDPIYIAGAMGLFLVALIGGGLFVFRVVRTRAAAKPQPSC
jgi:photosystem II stability/assembly factor-like uncharacterized protein